jgi:hypothetical protein
MRLQFAPEGNAFQQRARLVYARQAVAERGIHMEMGIDKRRRDQITAGVNFSHTHLWQRGADGSDAAALDRDVDMLASIGQAGIAYDQIHLLLPR